MSARNLFFPGGRLRWRHVQYVTFHADYCYPVPTSMTCRGGHDRTACVAVHTVEWRASSPGDAAISAWADRLLTAQIAKQSGIRHIIGTDLLDIVWMSVNGTASTTHSMLPKRYRQDDIGIYVGAASMLRSTAHAQSDLALACHVPDTVDVAC